MGGAPRGIHEARINTDRCSCLCVLAEPLPGHRGGADRAADLAPIRGVFPRRLLPRQAAGQHVQHHRRHQDAQVAAQCACARVRRPCAGFLRVYTAHACAAQLVPITSRAHAYLHHSVHLHSSTPRTNQWVTVCDCSCLRAQDVCLCTSISGSWFCTGSCGRMRSDGAR